VQGVSSPAFSWSPDGSTLAVAADLGDDTSDVRLLRSVAQATARPGWQERLPGSRTSFLWSPGGSQLAFLQTGQDEVAVYVIRADGSHLREMYRGPLREHAGALSPEAGAFIHWQDDNTLLLLGSTLQLVGVAKGSTREVTGFGDRKSMRLSTSPDGRYAAVAFSAAETDSCRFGLPGRLAGLILVDLATGVATDLVDESEAACYLPKAVWSPDGARLAFYTNAGERCRQANAGGLRLLDIRTGATSRILEDDCGISEVTWSPGGELALISVGGNTSERCTFPGAPFPYGRAVLWTFDPDSQGAAVPIDEACRFSGLIWSQDGRQLAYGWTESHYYVECGIYVFREPWEAGTAIADVKSGESRRVSSTSAGLDSPSAWLQDGRGIVVSRGKGTPPEYVVTVDGTDVSVTEAPQLGGVLSPNGRRIAVRDPAGGGTASLAAVDEALLGERQGLGLGIPDSPGWSADSKAYVYSARPAGGFGWRRYELAIDGSKLELIADGPVEDRKAFSPDNQKVAFFKGNLVIANADGSGATEVAVPGATQVRWSPDGSSLIAFSLTGQREIFFVKGDGTGLREIARGALPISWSVDGTKLALEMDGLAILDVATAAITRLSNARGISLDVAWSPDGQVVAYQAPGEAGQPDIFTADIVTGESRRITTTPASEFHLAFSGDSRLLSFKAAGEVAAIDLQTGLRTTLYRTSSKSGSVGDPLVWSPDGQTLAFFQQEDGIYVVAPDGTDLHLLAAVGRARVTELVWLDDGHISFTVLEELLI
jgi:Tol biopolymer transport system component